MKKWVILIIALLATACSNATVEPLTAVSAITPATSVDQARIVRERDWVKGATNPAVTIIEYGDFQ